jgi:hypothetical protein
MKRHLLKLLGLVAVASLTVGCHHLLPSGQNLTLSIWTNYDDVELAFQNITPYQTTVKDLWRLGFDPKASPNVKILTYVDIVQMFLPNAGISKADLPAAVTECIEAKEKSHAYLVDLQNSRYKRHGNVLLDIFGFKRQTHQSGWQFKGLILIKSDLVVYKLASGEPRISREEDKVKPLGPVQELDGGFSSAVKYAK